MVPNNWEKEEPCGAPNLLDLCANTIILNSQLLFNQDQIQIRQHEIEAILNQTKNYKHLDDPKFFDRFIDGGKFPTSILPIRCNRVSDELFAQILVGQSNNLQEVDLTGNKSLGSKLLLDKLLEFRDQLPQLTSLFASGQWIFSLYKDCMDVGDLNASMELPQQRSRNQNYACAFNEVIHFTQFFPSLSHFRYTCTDDFCSNYEKPREFMWRVLLPLSNLRILELNKWNKLGRMEFLTPLMDTLTTLRLYDCPDVKAGIYNIMKLKNLESLDISQTTTTNGTFNEPASTLYKLISSLPNLKRLDIANTNLCCPFTEEEERPERLDMVETDVHGLMALRKPLEFLSVFHCDHISPSTILPAYVVCSELTEEHLLVGLRVYMDKLELLQSLLNELFQIYRLNNEEANFDHTEGLNLILQALSTHRYSRTLQISGTAALFYAIRHATSLGSVVKRRVVEIMLNALETFNDETVIVRNACLSFCQLEIPKDIVFAYSTMVSLLVRVLNSHSGDSTTPRVVIYLLNSMACQTGHESKVEVGVSGAIHAIMMHIARKIERQVCDETVEVAWSFLWNITDETAANCDIFLKSEGITLFWKCYQQWSSRKDLVRNMLGLMGNLAEVEGLRWYLMNDDLIKIFLDLLDVIQINGGDGIETSYNSAGILAQLLSDKNWQNVTISKEFITNRIIDTTSKWSLDSRRFINYRSFGPILKLLTIYESPASQIWALFAIANLTTTDQIKYSEFVVREGGIPILEQILRDPRSTDKMRAFVNIIFTNVEGSNQLPTPTL